MTLSPVVCDHTGKRQLTDVMLVESDLVLAFECKAAAVLTREATAPTAKRAKLLRKQLSKGIAQLQGVAVATGNIGNRIDREHR